jgi:hypothetical protein
VIRIQNPEWKILGQIPDITSRNYKSDIHNTAGYQGCGSGMIQSGSRSINWVQSGFGSTKSLNPDPDTQQYFRRQIFKIFKNANYKLLYLDQVWNQSESTALLYLTYNGREGVAVANTGESTSLLAVVLLDRIEESWWKNEEIGNCLWNLLLRNRVSTEFRQHGIPYIFVTSVCHTELPKIPRNYTEFCVTECGRIPRNFALYGISHDWVVTNRLS